MEPGRVPIPADFEIPTFCKAGVMTREGKDFKVEVQEVPVPEPGTYLVCIMIKMILRRGLRNQKYDQTLIVPYDDQRPY
jgi:hypothetical protein